jgi:D-glycero-D-manno-heptose 1,7-bisphosphate phosphatase
LLRRAASELRIELGRSVIIGDRDTDLLAGKAAGIPAILVRTGEGGSAAADADIVADDLAAAVRLILRARRVTAGR